MPVGAFFSAIFAVDSPPAPSRYSARHPQVTATSMTHRHASTRAALIAGAALLAASLGLSSTSLTTGLPIATTPNDFLQPGTQPMTLNQSIQSSPNCAVCHGNFDVDQEPYTRWASSMM